MSLSRRSSEGREGKIVKERFDSGAEFEFATGKGCTEIEEHDYYYESVDFSLDDSPCFSTDMTPSYETISGETLRQCLPSVAPPLPPRLSNVRKSYTPSPNKRKSVNGITNVRYGVAEGLGISLSSSGLLTAVPM